MRRSLLAMFSVMAVAFCARSASSETPPPGLFELVAINDVDQSEGVDQLVRFDPVTGVGTVVGSLGNMFVNCEALAAFTRSPVVGVDGGAEALFTVDEHTLLGVNQFTGLATPIIELGFPDVDGLSFIGNVLYGVTYGSNQILRVVGLPFGPIVQPAADDVLAGHRLNDISFLSNAFPGAHAFIITDDTPTKIYEVNPDTGEKFHKWVISGPTSMEALVPFQIALPKALGETTVFLSAADRGNTKDLVRIELPGDSVFGTATFLGPLSSGFRDVEGLAWLPRTVFDALVLALNGPTDATPPMRRFALQQNAPNPFNPTTQIRFDLSDGQDIELSVYDVTGRKVVTLARGAFPAGPHVIAWNGRTESSLPVATGVYRNTLRA